MKKFSLFILFLSIIFISVPVSAKRISNWIELSSGISITGIGGASVYIVDLRSPAYDPVTRGDFGIQFAGLASAYLSGGVTIISTSGVSINVHFAELNHLNIGASSAAVLPGVWFDFGTISASLNWQAIVTNLLVSGNSEYVYGFDPEKARYVALRLTTGVTDVYTKFYLDMD